MYYSDKSEKNPFYRYTQPQPLCILMIQNNYHVLMFEYFQKIGPRVTDIDLSKTRQVDLIPRQSESF